MPATGLPRLSLPTREAARNAPLESAVEWPETEPAIQNQSGRLWDVVFMAAVAARAAARRGEGDRVTFKLDVVPRGRPDQSRNYHHRANV